MSQSIRESSQVLSLKPDWHGMLQNGTGYMDGVPGFTQVSYDSQSRKRSFPSALLPQELLSLIASLSTVNTAPTGKSLRDFTDSRWHSHYSNTMAVGLVGG